MSRKQLSRIALPITVFVAAMCMNILGRAQSELGTVHMAPTATDQMAECVRAFYGKPVLVHAATRSAALNDCPKDRQELITRLNGQGVLLYATTDWIVLVPKNFFAPLPPYTPKELADSPKEHTITVQVNVTHEGVDERRAAEVLARVLQAARAPWFSGFSDAWKEPHVVVGIRVDIVSVGASESAPVAFACLIESTANEIARIVYVKFANGNYDVQWDSPLLHNHNGRLEFEDVTGDGIKEILHYSELSDVRNSRVLLTVFDISGRELTRQMYCEGDNPFIGLPPNAAVCPIMGNEDISVAEHAGSKAILVDGGRGGYYRWTGSIFSASGGHQGAEGALLDPRMKASQENQKGMHAMAARHYDDAVERFVQAATLDPSSALYANNAGFAYYRLGKLTESVSWLDKAVSLDAGRAVAYLNLGDAYVGLNRTSEAREAYSTYLKLKPDGRAASEVKRKLAALAQ